MQFFLIVFEFNLQQISTISAPVSGTNSSEKVSGIIHKTTSVTKKGIKSASCWHLGQIFGKNGHKNDEYAVLRNFCVFKENNDILNIFDLKGLFLT